MALRAVFDQTSREAPKFFLLRDLRVFSLLLRGKKPYLLPYFFTYLLA
jgi:hypothetical protein